jgi:hypothetical protein
MLGIITGYLVGFLMQLLLFSRVQLLGCDLTAQPSVEDDLKLSDTTDKNLVLVGVMTAKAFLETRVVPAYSTWVQSIPGKVICACIWF